jgi:hypothetical protein
MPRDDRNMFADPSAVTYPRLAFIVDEPLIARFFLLLQQGVKISSCVGCSVDAFLREELGAGHAMIEKIQSIVLNGKPVDDIGGGRGPRRLCPRALGHHARIGRRNAQARWGLFLFQKRHHIPRNRKGIPSRRGGG